MFPDTSGLLVKYLPIVANSVDGDMYTVKYNDHYNSYLPDTTTAVESIFSFPLKDAMVLSLKSSNTAISLGLFSMAFIHCQQTKKYFFFDSHPRDSEGMPTPNIRSAVLLVFESLASLENHITSLARALTEDKFEITCAKFSKCQLVYDRHDTVKLVENITFHTKAIQGTIRQGSPNFCAICRGRQYCFMALSSLLYSELLPVTLIK